MKKNNSKIPAGKLKIIHVNQHIIRANKKNGASDAPLTIRLWDGTLRVYGIEINGPSVVIYSPDRPLPCGAKVWIETRSEIKYIEEA